MTRAPASGPVHEPAPDAARAPLEAECPGPTSASARASSAPERPGPALASASGGAPPVALPPGSASHPWEHAARAERLDARFPAPAGFSRAAVEEGSFAAFTRSLPLAPIDTKVVSFAGKPLYADGAHPRIAAVVDIDVGDRDLQQCADAVIRMHAEWRYGRGERPSYRALSGLWMPYAEWMRGARPVAEGQTLMWRRVATPAPDEHALFRRYLDAVFTWANTASLARDSRAVSLVDVTGGDFFVLADSPVGHAVLVLDVAKGEGGEVALLLGQSFMPAQSFHVLRSTAAEVWFVVPREATHVATPFWRPFPISSLRRLP